MIKLSTLASEPAHDGRRVESAVIQVHRIDAPLAHCRVIESKRLLLHVQFFVGTGHLELFEVRVAVEEFMVVRDAVELNPGIGVVETVRQAADVSFPVADEEVEVVRAIALRKERGVVGGLGTSEEGEHSGENEKWEHFESADHRESSFPEIDAWEEVSLAAAAFPARTLNWGAYLFARSINTDIGILLRNSRLFISA